MTEKARLPEKTRSPSNPRWQWTLANGGTVAAVIDLEAGTETVSQGERVLSQCSRGEKPEGHTVLVSPDRGPGLSERPPIEAVITFAPHTSVCVLRVDGQEVAPALWPVRQRAVPAPEPDRPWGTYLLLGLGVVVLVICGVVVRALRNDAPARIDGKLDRVHRSNNGLFVAHYPEDFAPRPAVLPSGVGGIVLEDKAKTTNIAIAALTVDASGARDPWVLQQQLRDEVVANLSKGAGRYEEATRRDDTCLGHPGAVVTGQIMSKGQRQAKVWSCAFVRETAGYFTLYMLTEPLLTADERRVRSILDATELTRLADLGTLAPGSSDPMGIGTGTAASGPLPALHLQ
jgi:hypothetical protein